MSGCKLFLRKLWADRLAFAGLLIVVGLLLGAILAPYLAPYPEDVYDIHPAERLRPPSLEHLFGTNHMGADLFSRVLFGTRITLMIAVIAVGTALLVGVPAGLVAGFSENWLSEVIMRVADVFLALPQAVLAIAIAQTLGPSLPNVILALSITYWPWFTRLVFAEVRSLKHEVFVEATAALGVGPWRTVIMHLLPNVSTPIIVRCSIGMGFTILTAAMLGFLGLGAQPPTPEWGRSIAEARQYLPEAWWYATFPGLAIFVAVMGFNMLGDGLRDLLDPRLRRSGQ